MHFNDLTAFFENAKKGLLSGLDQPHFGVGYIFDCLQDGYGGVVELSTMWGLVGYGDGDVSTFGEGFETDESEKSKIKI